MFKTEVELAAVVKKHLEKQGWDVYPEVELYSGGPRCDLVAFKGEKIWAIECKLNSIKEAAKAASRWHDKANLVSIAIPVELAEKAIPLEMRIPFRMGVIEVHEWGAVDVPGQEPYYYKKIKDTRLLEACRQDHKELGQAGAKSKYYTPYLKYLHQLSKLCKEHPGEELANLMDKMATANFLYLRIKASAKDGKIEGCKLWHRNHKDYLYPTGFGPHGKDKV